MGFRNLHLRTFKLAGGGADTAEQYKRCQDGKNRFCICIVDSDRNFPGDRLKETASNVRALDDEAQPLCLYLHTHGHELENYIPTSWYSIVTEDDPSKRPAVEFLERLESSTAREARKFVDMKNGLLLAQILEAAMKQPRGRTQDSFWLDLLAVLDEVADDRIALCLELQACQNLSNCKCRVMVGFGKHVIDKVIDLLHNTHWRRLENGMCPDTRSDWEALGGTVLAWCCGTQAMFAA
jgi:hypothetical protein